MSANSLKSQNEQKIKYVIKHYTVENGLFSNLINDMNVDRNGYIWIATQSGLSRFDGKTFLNYTSLNLKSLKSNRFLKLIKESDTSMYAINEYYQKYIITQNSELKEIKNWNEEKENFIKNNIENKNKNPQTQQKLNVNNHFKEYYEEYNFKTLDNNNYLIKTQPEELAIYYNRIKISPIINSPPNLKFVIENRFCIIDLQNNLHVFHQGKLENIIRLESALKETINIHKLYITKNNELVTLNHKGQLYEISLINNRLNFEKKDYTLNLDEHLTILDFKDKSQKNIVYSKTKGFYILKKSYFYNDQISHQMNESNTVYRLIYNNAQLIPNDLIPFLRKKFKLDALSLLFNKNKDTICLIENNSIHYIANKLIQSLPLLYDKKPVYLKKRTDAFIQGKQIFLFLDNELYELEQKQNLKLIAKPYTKLLKTVCKTNNKNEWLLFYENEGLIHYNTQSKTSKRLNYFKDKEVRSIIYDSTINQYWVFTYGFGIHLMDKNWQAKPFLLAHNPYLNFAHYYLKDQRGDYWIPTNNGLFSFKQIDVKNCIENPKMFATFEYYSTQDGLINSEFNGGYSNSGIVLPNGQLAFSNINGVVVLDPIFNAVKDFNYPILIDDFKHNGVSIEKKENYNFVEGSGSIEIIFSSPFYYNTSNSILEYKIQGINQSWLPLEDNKITFLSLKQGEYIITIRKIGDKHPLRTKKIIITIAPPWFKTNTAYIIYIFSFLGIGSIITRYFF